MSARPADPGPVLLLAPTGRDAPLAAGLLESAGIRVRSCESMAEVCEGIPDASAAVLAEEALDPASCETLLLCLESQPPWSDLPVGLVRYSDAILPGMREALVARGNVTLLERPIRRVTLVTTVRAFQRARRRQHEVRDLVLQHEEAVRSRDRFLAILGHELRNPLGAVLLAVERMRRADGNAFRAEREVLHRQAGVLTRLVDDLLDVGRVAAGKIELQRSSVDLRLLAARAVAVASEKPGRARVTLDAHERPYVVWGDPVRLEQIFTNLVTNAVKYTPPTGRVTVSLAEEQGRVVARVADTGIGIETGMLERVFELFTQAESSLARAQGGMGIGLTLVKSLVELHGGSVRAESAGPGRGSTFTVALPSGSPAVAVTPPAGIRTGASASRRVVVVEDNPDLRQQLVALLEDLGHRVEAAADGFSGIERIARMRPEVALVDIGLPGLDGYEVARRVRALLGSDVGLVALTGYGQPEDRQRALDAGFDAHLTKPVTATRLADLMQWSPHA